MKQVKRREDCAHRFHWSLYRLIRRLDRTKMYAAEVGVFRGDTSAFLLEEFSGLILNMVDRWEAYAVNPYCSKPDDSIVALDQDGMNEARDHAIMISKAYPGRAIIRWRDSVSAARDLLRCYGGPGGLDFVFIDAEHTYEAVKTDMEAWWPVVRAGGFLCGHDYRNGDYPGVTKAVDEWAERQQLTVKGYSGRVWVIYRPELQRSDA